MQSEEVYMVCDKCGTATPSGLTASIEAIRDASNTFRNNQTDCPVCRNMILWSKAELWLESVAKQRLEKGAKNAVPPSTSS